MKRCLFLLLLVGCSAEAVPEPSNPPVLRVRLASVAERDRVRVEAAGAYRLVDAATGEVLEEGSGLARDVPVLHAKIPHAVRFEPADRRFTVNDRAYRGALVVHPGPQGAVLVVETDLELYLPGVLGGEMGTRFHPAALRAQAIAARTYAYRRMLDRGEDGDWHVADDVTDQVFLGETSNPAGALDTAVRNTRGMVLLWNSRPFQANFCSTCGGHTANVAEALSREVIPPLVGVPCGFCSISPRFRWNPPIRIPLEEARVALGLPAAPASAEVIERGRDGRAIRLRFLCPAPVERTGSDARFRLGPGRLFGTRIHRLTVTDGALVIEGGGWGHGVGLCQWGAEGMARAGAAAADILAFYYPSATLGRIY